MTNSSRTTVLKAGPIANKSDSPMRAMWPSEPGKFELRQQPISAESQSDDLS